MNYSLYISCWRSTCGMQCRDPAHLAHRYATSSMTFTSVAGDASVEMQCREPQAHLAHEYVSLPTMTFAAAASVEMQRIGFQVRLAPEYATSSLPSTLGEASVEMQRRELQARRAQEYATPLFPFTSFAGEASVEMQRRKPQTQMAPLEPSFWGEATRMILLTRNAQI